MALSNLKAVEASPVAPVDDLTVMTASTATPGWVTEAQFSTEDGTCTEANNQWVEGVPIGFCQKGKDESYRFDCDGAAVVLQKWGEGAFNNCENAGYPQCNAPLKDSHWKELDTCRLSGTAEGKNWSKDGAACEAITLADADTIFACQALCDADFSTSQCKRVVYNTATKKCNGFTDDCNSEDSIDDAALEAVTIAANSEGKDRVIKQGCTGTALPGGVITRYDNKDGDWDAATCTEPTTEDVEMEYIFFVFDKCHKAGTESTATYCVDNKVYYSKWTANDDCTGTPHESTEITKTCTLSADMASRSYVGDWWGKCGGAADIAAAELSGVSATCVPGTPVDPSCTCEGEEGGKIDGVWDGSTCGLFVGEYGCNPVKAHFSTGDGAADADAYAAACCGGPVDSGAASTTTSVALLGTLLAFAFRKFL